VCLDTLLDLHAKLSTVVRYYDRMLEERLSKAYSQHSIGGYTLPVPRQAAGPYPSMQSNPPNVTGPAENFYTGEVQPDYGRSSLQQPYGQASQPTSYNPHAAYDRRSSVAASGHGPYLTQQNPQRTGSWGAPVPGQAQPQSQTVPYTQPEAASQAPLAPPVAPESMGTTPTTDPTASFYFNNQPSSTQQPQSGSGPEPALSPYPNLSQSIHTYQPSLPQTPASVSAQLAQPPSVQQGAAQQAAPAQQQQQPYWQHTAAQQTTLPPVWQAPIGASYPGYTQEAFPSAPHHAPQQPVVEESLIEL
jgi:hepatocyte growth factor-regulated tyrosine kinase substrate